MELEYCELGSLTKVGRVRSQQCPGVTVGALLNRGRGQILTDQNWQFARMLALRGVLAGLAFLHERGLVHGDLKVGIEISGVDIDDC